MDRDRAPAGCTPHKTVHPGTSQCTLLICSNDKWLKKCAQSGCTSLKIVHPALKMCTPGAGCMLNFGHCHRKIKKDGYVSMNVEVKGPSLLETNTGRWPIGSFSKAGHNKICAHLNVN